MHLRKKNIFQLIFGYSYSFLYTTTEVVVTTPNQTSMVCILSCHSSKFTGWRFEKSLNNQPFKEICLEIRMLWITLFVKAIMTKSTFTLWTFQKFISCWAEKRLPLWEMLAVNVSFQLCHIMELRLFLMGANKNLKQQFEIIKGYI